MGVPAGSTKADHSFALTDVYFSILEAFQEHILHTPDIIPAVAEKVGIVCRCTLTFVYVMMSWFCKESIAVHLASRF